MKRIQVHETLGAVVFTVGLALSGCGGSGPQVPSDVAAPGDGTAPVTDTADEETPVMAPSDPLEEARAGRRMAPAEPYWPYQEAVLLAAADSMKQAESCLHDALAIDPTYAPALAELSRMLYQAGRHAEAIPILERARATAPLLPRELLEALALHYEAMDRVDEARATLQQAEPLPPVSSVTTFVNLRADELEAAAKAAEAAVEADPKNAVHRNNLGVVRLRQGDPKAAREALQTAHELNPHLPGPLYNLALVERYYLVDVEAARASFARYWALSHDDPDSLRKALFPGEPVPELARKGTP